MKTHCSTLHAVDQAHALNATSYEFASCANQSADGVARAPETPSADNAAEKESRFAMPASASKDPRYAAIVSMTSLWRRLESDSDCENRARVSSAAEGTQTHCAEGNPVGNCATS